MRMLLKSVMVMFLIELYLSHPFGEHLNSSIEQIFTMPTGVFKRSAIHKKHISEALKGRVVSKETKERLSKSHKGIIPVNKGIARSEETKKRISEGTRIGMLKSGAADKIRQSKIRLIKSQPDFFKKRGAWLKSYYREHPEKLPIAIIQRKCKEAGIPINKYVSKGHRKLFDSLKENYPDAELNYPIKTNETVRFGDIVIPSLKLIYEYDGEYWHQNKDKDASRDKELYVVGWSVIHIKGKRGDEK